MNCPCRSGLDYDRCCGRFISQEAIPENAEQLMRSRYSAFAVGNADYLQRSWHPDFRPRELRIDPRQRWIGLEIIDAEQQENEARVEFEARMLVEDRVEALHENSRFLRIDGRWFYTEGDMMKPLSKPWKPGRNETCPCGSGRKFKRCCGGAS